MVMEVRLAEDQLNLPDIPQCQANIHAERHGHEDCRRRAVYVVDGEFLCKPHTEKEVLRLVMEGARVVRYGGYATGEG